MTTDRVYLRENAPDGSERYAGSLPAEAFTGPAATPAITAPTFPSAHSTSGLDAVVDAVDAVEQAAWEQYLTPEPDPMPRIQPASACADTDTLITAADWLAADADADDTSARAAVTITAWLEHEPVSVFDVAVALVHLRECAFDDRLDLDVSVAQQTGDAVYAMTFTDDDLPTEATWQLLDQLGFAHLDHDVDLGDGLWGVLARA